MSKKFFSYIFCIFSDLKGNIFFPPLILFALFNSFYGIFSIFLSSKIIENIEIKNTQNVYFWIWIFVFLTIILLLVKIFYDAIYFRFYAENRKSFTVLYFKKFISLDNTSVERYGTGKLSHILNMGIFSLEKIIDGLLFAFIQIFVIIYAFVLIFLKVPNIFYFIGFLLLFFVIVVIFAISIQQIFSIRKEVKKYSMEIDRKKVKILMSKFEILQNGKTDYEIEEIVKLYNTEAKVTYNAHIKKGYFFALADGILKFFEGFVFVIIGIGVVVGNYKMATFALFLWLLKIISEESWKLRKNIATIIDVFVHWEKLVDTFSDIPLMKNTENFPEFVFKKGKIEIKNIDFSYEKEKFIFQNFSLSLEGGKKYAFVGESGGGKSTILKLLSAYIVPNSGNILIDNQDLSQISLKSYYKDIGYLTQDPSVFDGSIYENLTFALNYTPMEKEIQNVLQKAKCEFVYDFEFGLQTEIGERGIRLSGGQKQRLAIAKIMLKNPKIILLDEATSALDSFNEEQISIALENLFQNKTVIIVAHRLQTVKNADEIFLLENGRIIERGTHEALYKQKRKYFRMIELQSGF